MRRLVEEISLATRRLSRRNRGFAVVSVATLAVGIGSTSAIFSAVNPILLRPLPFPEASRLIQVGGGVSLLELAAIESSTPAFESSAGFRQTFVPTSSEGRDEGTQIWYVTGNYFGLLGLRPQLGRFFSPGEKNVAVLSDRLWRSRYSSDPKAIGKLIQLRSATVQIVGVGEPSAFVFPLERVSGLEVWTPLERDESASSGRANVRIVARLSPASTLARAQSQLDTLAARLANERLGSTSPSKLRAASLRDEAVRELRPLLIAASFIAVAVLLIGLGNLTNLQISRHQHQARDMAVRTALGGSQRDLLRLGLAESFVLCGAGGALGFVLAAVSRNALVALLPRSPYTEDIRFNWAVAVFSLALSVASVLLLTVLPRLRPTLDPLRPAQHRGSSDQRWRLFRQGVVGAELGLALSAAFCAGLLLNSFWRLTHADIGFHPAGVAVLPLQRLQDVYRNPESQTQFLTLQVARLRALPGVQSVGVTSFLPLSGQPNTGNAVTFDESSDVSEFRAGYRSTSGEYFKALGIVFLAGEAYSDTVNHGEPIAVINEALARRVQASPQSLLGRRIKLGRRDAQVPWRTIVGVVRNLRESYRDDTTQPEVFVPMSQDFQFGRANLIVRSTRPMNAVLAEMRSQIDERLLAKTGPQGTSMDDLLQSQLLPQRSRLQLLGFVALVACTLALIGIYGVVSYAASRRMTEIGIRVALGATPLRVVRFVVQSETSVSFGVALLLGPLLALAVSRQLGGLVYHVPVGDPWTLGAVTLLLSALAGLASLVPAIRACRSDPAVVLRAE